MSKRKRYYVHDVLNRHEDYHLVPRTNEKGDVVGYDAKFHHALLKLRGLRYDDSGHLVPLNPQT